MKDMANAAEMLWGVVANASGGDWSKQTEEWQQAARRAREDYFAACRLLRLHRLAENMSAADLVTLADLAETLNRAKTPSSVPNCAQNGAGEGNRTPDQQLGKG